MSDTNETAPRGVPGALPNADRAPTGRAKCIACTAAIAAKTIRIAVVRKIDTGRFVTMGAGYLHPACVEEWASREGIDFPDLITKVVAHSALPELPAPFGSAPPAPAPPAVAKPIAVAPAPAEATSSVVQELPPFDGADEKTLRALAKKLDKFFDPNGFKHDNEIEKAGIAWRRRAAVYWYLTAHQLVTVETNAGMLDRLVENLQEAPKGVVVPLLGRLNATAKELLRNYSSDTLLLPGWLRLYDELTVHALCTEPAALEAAMDALPTDIRLGVAFVRGRSGLPIADTDRKAIFKHLVHATLTKDARVYWKIKVVQGDSVETAFELAGPELLPRLAALFVPGDEAWNKAVEAGLARGTWTTVAQVHAGLRRVPLDKFITLVGKRSYLDRDPAALFAVLDARQDTTAAVLASARVLPSDYGAQELRTLRELLLVWALSRRAAQGEPVLREDANELSLGQFAQSLNEVAQHPMRDAYLAVMRALPRADARALVQRQLDAEYGYNDGLPILAVHFDDALLRSFITKEAAAGYLPAVSFVLIGTAALPALVDAYTADAAPKARDTVLAAITAILSNGSGAFDPQEQAAVETLGATVIHCSDEQNYWSSAQRESISRLLLRMVPAQRRELLLTKLREAAYVARPYRFVPLEEDAEFRIAATRILAARASTLTTEDDFDFAVRALADAAPQIFAAALGQETVAPALLRRLETGLGEAYADFAAARGVKLKSWLERLRDMCAEASGPYERIYLFEPPFAVADCGLAPRADSWSRLGGAGPGVATPTQRDGESLEHVLTLDLQKVPELVQRFPGARALALYVPDARGGENYAASRLVAVPARATPPMGGEPLFVLPLDVPSAIFERRTARANPLLAEIRTAIFNRSGWALGEPMWIQEDEGDTDLVMQLADRLGLNLGDSGGLYVFSSAVYMQSH